MNAAPASDPQPLPRLGVLGWSRPLPQAAAAWLVEQAGWTGNGPLELETWLLVVPTRQSGRRLREALALRAAEAGQAVFSPRVVVPSQVPEIVSASGPVGSRLEGLLAWGRVLRETAWTEMSALLPVEPLQRDVAWSLGLARRLLRVQGQLAEEGRRFADVAMLEGNPERGRWQQLAALEARWEATLQDGGRISRARLEQVGLATASLPAPLERVALLAVPDLVGVAVQHLARIAATRPVDVLVYADPEHMPLAEAFDPWGRPRPGYWQGRELPWRDFEQQVRLEANPATQAARIAARAQRHARPDEWLAVAVADPEVRVPLEQELAAMGLRSFNPEGVSWAQGRLYGLLLKLAALVDQPSQAVIGALLRHPDVLAKLGPEAEVSGLLEAWDRLRGKHLVEDLAAARIHAGSWPVLARALEQVEAWRRELLDGSFADGALALPAAIYEGVSIDGGSSLAESARRWVETVEMVTAATTTIGGTEMARTEQWRLALETFAEGARFETKQPDALELGGWLELLWADAEQAIVAGVNEGRLPESVVGDAFLPESLRRALGLRSNAQRLARDAYLLTAVMASRPGDRVELLVGKTAANGEPLRPSRLLLAGNDAALPVRVRRLFQPLEATQANLPWRRAWPLRPREAPPPASVSVTALRDWLDCPFRFYLKRVLNMEPIDLTKAELDARDFGSLVHVALQAMGEEPRLRELTDEGALRDGLLEVFDAEARRVFGDEPTLPLVIQLESGRQRLRRVAAIEVAERLEGWRTEKVEWAFAVPLGPLTVKGKIDRIDRHADGRVRVIDYKTSDQPKAPLEAHVGTLRPDDETRPDWLQLEVDGKRRRWVDLQLPLYGRALAPEYGNELSYLYFNLPKAVGDTGLLAWPEGQRELQAAAERCAEAVAAAIAGGVFWPPVEDAGRPGDEWSPLFHGGVAASVAADWIRRGGGKGDA